jgi:hypothetical protein
VTKPEQVGGVAKSAFAARGVSLMRCESCGEESTDPSAFRQVPVYDGTETIRVTVCRYPDGCVRRSLGGKWMDGALDCTKRGYNPPPPSAHDIHAYPTASERLLAEQTRRRAKAQVEETEGRTQPRLKP